MQEMNLGKLGRYFEITNCHLCNEYFSRFFYWNNLNFKDEGIFLQTRRCFEVRFGTFGFKVRLWIISESPYGIREEK